MKIELFKYYRISKLKSERDRKAPYNGKPISDASFSSFVNQNNTDDFCSEKILPKVLSNVRMLLQLPRDVT